MISEEMLRSAAREAEEDLYGMEGKDRTFYRSLEGKLSRFYRRKHHPAAWRVLRSAAGLAVSVLVLSVLVLTFHSEARAATLGWVKEQYHNVLRYTFPGAPTETPTLAYEPQWLPEGYVETERIVNGGYHSISYRNGQGREINFAYVIGKDGTEYFIDPQGAEVREIDINGQAGWLHLTEVQNCSVYAVYSSSSVTWYSSDGNVLFQILSSLSPSEMIRVAESIREA